MCLMNHGISIPEDRRLRRLVSVVDVDKQPESFQLNEMASLS